MEAGATTTDAGLAARSDEIVDAVRDELFAFAEATARAILARTEQATRLTAVPEPAPVVAPRAPLAPELTGIPRPRGRGMPVSSPARAWAAVPVEALLPMGALLIVLVITLAWLG